jgi:acyl-CoA thioester hydrolase
MPGTTIYRCAIEPEWIDYNRHLRDAYYALVVSLALDALMDQVGLDADYRERTQCTLYSLEMHMHWLKEVKGDDSLQVDVHVLGLDAKRLHVGLDLRIPGREKPAATAEVMLLHVCQGETPGSAPFPEPVATKLAALRQASDGHDWSGPRSRALTLSTR